MRLREQASKKGGWSVKRSGRVSFAVLVAIALGLAMSVSGGGAPSARGAPAWSLPTQPVTLTYWDTGNGTKGDLITSLIAEYQRAHPNVTIKFETNVKSDKIAVSVSTGTAAEIIEVADFNLPKFLQVGALDPLPPAAWGKASVKEVTDLYLPGALNSMMEGGKLYAVPDQMNAWSLFINNRLFREAGLDPVKDAPKTWAGVVRLNNKLTKKQGDRIVQKGFEFRYVCSDSHWKARMFHVLMYQAGGEVIKDGKPVFNSEAGVRALNVWKSLTVAPQVSQNTCSSPYQDFAVEQDVMMFGGPHAPEIAARINPKMQDNYTAVPLPQLRPGLPATLIYSYNWAVNAKASAVQKQVAWDFIHYLSSKPELWWGKIKFLQGTRGWFDMPAAKESPFLQVYIHDIAVGRALGRTLYQTELQAILARVIDRVALGSDDPKRALDQAVEEFNRAAK
jgi:multiple sugar transport system substrate-binding protein